MKPKCGTEEADRTNAVAWTGTCVGKCEFGSKSAEPHTLFGRVVILLLVARLIFMPVSSYHLNLASTSHQMDKPSVITVPYKCDSGFLAL